MSSPSEKLGVKLSEAIATLEQLIEQFDLEKEALVTEKDEEIEAVKLELEAEKAKLRATRLAFEAAKPGVSEDGCHMIVAIDLNIMWSETPEHWAWTTVPESRHAVAELLNVCWLEISCRLDMDKLSPNTKYASYLVYKFTEDSDGFSSSPGQAYAGIAGEENTITNIYLVPEEDHSGSEKADQYPKERPDGWMEIQLGEYFIDEIETFGEIEMSFKETSGSWKNGLIVQGIEVRPK